MEILARSMAPILSEYLETFRVVVVGGARQVGKTTLVRHVPSSSYVSLDDDAVLRRAVDDPVAILDSSADTIVVDEYQRAGEGFLRAVKTLVDGDQRRGRVLLTGSSGYEASASVAEALAGRAGRLLVWPLSAGEIAGRPESFIDDLFDPDGWPGPPAADLGRSDLIEAVLRGGFPEVVVQRLDARQRGRWFDSYISQVIAREALRPLVDVRLERELRQIFSLVAASAPAETEPSSLAADTGTSRSTVTNYLTLLEALHVTHALPAWASSATTRAKRRPKTLVTDSGLAAHVTRAGPETFGPVADGVLAGRLFESFVLGELLRQVGWADTDAELLHYRDRDGREVDAIVEDRATGRIAGVEVKLTSKPTVRHLQSLAWLRDRHPDRFVVGVLVHSGPQTLRMGDRLWAVPVSRLWT